MDLELIVKTSAVLMSGSMVAALLRRAAPSTRHLVWHISIVVVLLAPVLMAVAPSFTVPIGPVVADVPVASFDETPLTLLPLNTESGQNSARETAAAIGALGTALTAAWFLLCWLLSGLSVWRGSVAAPEQWLNEARALARRLGVTSIVTVRQMRREGSPHVAGLFGSVVMLPPSATGWSVELRQSALVHELTHIRRRDRLTQAIAHAACAIYWFNPLVWRAAAGLARERERACDDAVLRFGARPSEYASLLLDLARSARHSWTPAAALSMARPSAMEGRLIAILADAVRTPRRSTRWLVAAGVLGITTAILGAQADRPAPIASPKPLIKAQEVMGLDADKSSTPVIGALVDALRDGNRQVREQAAIGLALTPGAGVVEALLGALQDADAQVREKAAIGLAFRRDPRIIAPLLTAIEDTDSQVREKAAIALGASGDPRAIPALTRAAKDPDPQVREKAVAGLFLLGRLQ